MRSRGQRAVLLVGMSILALAGAGCGGTHSTGGASSGSCVGPYLSDQPPSGPFQGPTPTVSPGDAITIYGHWYTSTCNDTGGHEPLVALAPVHLTLLLPDGTTKDLGELEAHGADMGFSTEVDVPTGTPAGAAIVRDDQSTPVTYEFEIGP